MYLPRSDAFILDDARRLRIKDLSRAIHQISIDPTKDPTGSFTSGGIEYFFVISRWIDEYDGLLDRAVPAKPKALLLAWRDEEKILRAQEIYFYEQWSNLKLGCFYYFICPHTGKHCTVLYFSSKGYLTSRHNIPKAHYKSQHEWESNNRFLRLCSIMMKDPTRDWGKEYYKGKITPYGRRIAKYYNKFAPYQCGIEQYYRRNKISLPYE